MGKQAVSDSTNFTAGTRSATSQRLEIGLILGWAFMALAVIFVGAALYRVILEGQTVVDSAAVSPATTTAGADNSLQFQRAWIRATPPGVSTAAAYVQIENSAGINDTLTAVTADAGYYIEIHTTVEQAGALRMQQLDALEIPAHTTVTLAPGGDHIMFVGLEHGFEPGERLVLTLHFEQAGAQPVEFMVRDFRQVP